jgi:protein TonB
MRFQQGVPWVRFTMNRQGKVLNAELYRASGHTALDREVVALVKRAEPLPPPPYDVFGDLLTMAVPVAFFIR